MSRKIIQKFLVGFIALLFVVGGVFVFTKNADASMPSNDVTGFVAPVTGATPSTDVLTINPNISLVTTFDAIVTAGPTWSPIDSPYLAETIYTATVELTSRAGGGFPSPESISPPPTLTDGGGLIGSMVVNGTGVGNTLTFLVTFPPTVAPPTTDITSAGVTGFVAPVTGAPPQEFGTLTPADASYTVTGLTWSPYNNPYYAETAYTATVILTSSPGYKFPIGGIATPTADGGETVSGGTTGIEGDISGNTLTFDVTFPPTVATDITSAGVIQHQ